MFTDDIENKLQLSEACGLLKERFNTASYRRSARMRLRNLHLDDVARQHSITRLEAVEKALVLSNG